MNYPLISEYIEAIKAAEDNFEVLTNLRPVLGDDGLPVMTSGNFAVVFKMQDAETGKFCALKCFTKEQEGRAEAYHQIADALKDVDSPYLVSLCYLDKELFVDTDQTAETEFPVLLMDWVEGKTLDKYLRENLDDKYALEMLAYRFSQLAQWLIPQPFAHGDLKPDNILVREDGTLVLVDYDGMYVPAMKGQKARELGSPDFRHPLRTENDFDEHIDDFPLISILLSLKILSNNPYLFKKYGASDRLLFSKTNYRDINQCNLLKELYPSNDSELNILLSLFTLAIEKSNLSNVLTLYFNLSNPLSTEVTVEDWEHRLDDEDGASYSLDRRRIFAFGSYDYDAKGYQIKEGTLVICDLAFNNYENDNHFLEEVFIPSSVKAIGENPFAGCIGLSIYCDSKWFKLENSILYTKDYSRLISSTNSTSETLKLNPNTKVIGAYALSFSRAKRIELPSYLLVIEDYAFSFSDIELLILPNVERIDKGAFRYCKSLANVILKGETTIDPSVFDECPNLKHIFVTASKIEYYKKILSNVADLVYEIGTWEDCVFGEVNFAKEIFELGQKYWEGKDVEKDLNTAIELYELASELGYSDANKELEYWGQYWFDEDKAIYSKDRTIFHGVLGGVYEYEIKEGTKFIADSACSDMGWEIDCSYFSKLTIPESIIGIGNNPFGCQMREVACHSPYFEVENDTLYSKGKKELIQCFNHETDVFVIPEGVEIIRSYAFYACNFRKVTIPSSVMAIGDNPFLEMYLLRENVLEITCNSPYFVVKNNTLYKKNEHKLISYFGKSSFMFVEDKTVCIGAFAFWHNSPKSIYLPSSIVNISEEAFHGTNFSLQNILVGQGTLKKYLEMLPEYSEELLEVDLSLLTIDEFGVLYDDKNNRLLSGGASQHYSIYKGTEDIYKKAFLDCRDLRIIDIPDSVTCIGDEAFCGCRSLKKVIIPDSVTFIGERAFKCCDSLEIVELSNSIAVLKECLFDWCTNLTHISIPDSVVRIENWAFENCKSLIEISIPNSVMSIGDGVFFGCEKLKSIIIPVGSLKKFGKLLPEYKDKLIEQVKTLSSEVTDEDLKNAWTDEFGAMYSKDQKRLLKCPNIRVYIIKTGTKVIVDHAFKGCTELQEVQIPTTVELIGEQAFDSCWNLGKLEIPNSVKCIGKGCFDGCSSLLEIKIPEGIIKIEDRTFEGCYKLQKVLLPDSLREIGAYAFTICSICEIELPKQLKIIGYNAFWKTGIKKLLIPNSVNRIDAGAFWHCSSLETITLPPSICEIKDETFFFCSKLSHIELPKSIKKIGRSAFDGAKSLNNIVIPEGVTQIEYAAFANCYSLEEIKLPSSISYIGEKVFIDCPKIKRICVPKGKKDVFLKLLPNYTNKIYDE